MSPYNGRPASGGKHDHSAHCSLNPRLTMKPMTDTLMKEGPSSKASLESDPSTVAAAKVVGPGKQSFALKCSLKYREQISCAKHTS